MSDSGQPMLLRTERYSNLSEKKLFIPIFYDNNHTGQNAKFQSKEVQGPKSNNNIVTGQSFNMRIIENRY